MKWDEQWAEVLSLTFVALGFILALLLQSVFFSIITVFLGGFVAARTYYLRLHKEPIFPFILIIIGFLFGYLVGNIWSSRLLTLIFFILGFALSYYLHVKNLFVIFKSRDFIK